jgi:DNA replication and repair protein RecF
MRSRNRLFEEGRTDTRWFAAIEAQMAELAVAVAAARRECIALLVDAIAAQPVDGPFPAAVISVAGTVEALLAGATATEAEDRVREELASGRPADRAAGRSRSGPHLSDLVVVHGPKAAPAEECSTGEQKALLIGIVLAHARLTAQLTGDTPIVLLDEVAAHLDGARRAALFGILLDLGAQVWMTGTEPGPFEALGGKAQFYRVEDATVGPKAGA